ncbi:unnamed protein product [Urochloa decumbens]|uniref:Receptor kinase-like protein Xa21 n=1 Tax=Urochloa decumbens TaxID=240449 RepID=A0ABC9GXR7_9POAL
MKLIAIRQLLMVLMSCCGYAVTCSNGNYTDFHSLLEFKKAISLDPKQALVSWNDSTRLCSWEGVQCSVRHPQRVTSLHLENLGLVGAISPSLGNLTFLKVLNLATNSFTGEIPASVGHLHNLQILSLSNNTLQGRILNLANCSKLHELQLANNHLAGQIPPDLPNGLRKLILSSNNLTGNIPSSLANITMLEALILRHNNILGSIPYEFTKLSRLQYLDMKENNLSGRFPQVIMNLSNLVELTISGNDLTGNIPSDVGSSLPNLKNLYLDANFFRGHIPSSIANASKLNFIGMSRNNFTGVIPNSIGKLHELIELNLEFNILQSDSMQDWQFMNSLTNCTELQVFSVSGNSLKGNVPNSIGNLSSQLQYLFLAKNQLSGKFPSAIANLHSLIIVALRMNKFIGAVPECLGTLKSLQVLRLDSNNFTGHVPSSLSNLSNLIGLDLGSNQLDGHIPPSLGELQMLEELSISSNNLDGIIPKELFRIPTLVMISLSFNNLYGVLPTEIGNAKHLTDLHLSSNTLSGEIPSTLENCESLEYLEMEHNTFSGRIPISFGKIRSLLYINLSHNNLTGLIPVSLGSLQLLEHLDLSFNNLEGEVPTEGIFSNVTAVRIDGNKGLCGGDLEKMHLVACPAIPLNPRKHKNYLFKKVMIPIAIILPLAIIIYVVLLRIRKQKRNPISLNSFDSKFPKVSYNDLARATEGFSSSNLIGQGRYSLVYRGNLFQDRTFVAVKVFNQKTKGTKKSFVAECNALRNIRHRNLVPILTVCSSIDLSGNDFKALVYEFMPQGDLHVLLYSTRQDGDTSALNHITLVQRLCIAVDIADALEYLHHNAHGTVIHCDLKPSNILLDDNMVAHVGDFGLARFRVDSAASSFTDSISSSSIAIKGTVGYVPPEYATGADVSGAGDVYSFGIVLLETFLRKRPTDDMFKDELDIARYVEMNFPESIIEIVDPELLDKNHVSLEQTSAASMEEKILECLLSVLNIGLRCANPCPSERMDMREVSARLLGIKESYLSEN